MKAKNETRMVYIGRVGYSAKAVIYAVLGFLIFYASFSAATMDNVTKKAVFKEVLYSPFGELSLGALILGLVCYVIWRLAQGIFNPAHLSFSNVKEVFQRIFYFISAFLYALVTYAAYSVLTGAEQDDGQGSQGVSAKLLQYEWGSWMVAACGIIVITFAFIQFKHTLKTDFMDKFDLPSMSSKAKKSAQRAGQGGFAARGVIYLLVGYFFLYAAYTNDSSEAGGLGKALSTLLAQPYGPYLCGLVGLGMICFSIFCAFEARYRTI